MRRAFLWPQVRSAIAVLVLVGAGALQQVVSTPSASASPSILYVAVGGSDTGNCHSSGSPCATITYAVSKAVSGDTIDIGPGTFTAAVSLFEQGVLTFQGSNALDPSSGTTVEPSTPSAPIFQADRSGFTLDQLTLNGLSGTAVGVGYGSTISINDSTITNSSDAVDVIGPIGDVTITDSTLSGNTVGLDDADPSSGATVTQSTIAGNTDGIEGDLVSMSIAGSIVGDNSGGDCAMTSGALTDNGYNDNGDGSCGFSVAAHSLTHTDPLLGVLGDNGGPTETQEPAPTSAVIGRIPPGTTGNGVTLCPGLDQRGVARPQGANCDMGAVEDHAPQVSGVFPPTGLTTIHTAVTIDGTGFTGATSVSFGGSPATGVTVTSDSSLTASAPLGTAGPVAVTVTGPTGTSLVNAAGQFTYTVDQTPTVVGCHPTCSATVSSPDPTTVTATGATGESAPGSLSLVVNTGTLSCGTRYDYLAPVSTLSTSGFAANAVVTVTDTVVGLPTTTGVKVCFEATGASSAAFLPTCRGRISRTTVCPVPGGDGRQRGRHLPRAGQRSPLLDGDGGGSGQEVLPHQGRPRNARHHQGKESDPGHRRGHRGRPGHHPFGHQQQNGGHGPAECRHRKHQPGGRLRRRRRQSPVHGDVTITAQRKTSMKSTTVSRDRSRSPAAHPDGRPQRLIPANGVPVPRSQ